MCEVLHCTPDYILWGISWANVQLIISDIQRVDYESSANAKNKSAKNNILDLSQSSSMDILKQIASKG